MQTGPSQSLHILVVEAEKAGRDILRRYLESPFLGFAAYITETESGQDALALLRGHSYDCVFLSQRLPGMHALEILKELYDPETDLAGNPIIILAEQGRQEEMFGLLRHGAQDYISLLDLSPSLLRLAINKVREFYELKHSRSQAEKQLRHAGRLEAVGHLTSGIAHDFNNLLMVVLGNTRLLRRRLEKEPGKLSLPEIGKKIMAIDAAANKGADLVRRLMVFTRQGEFESEVVDINNCVREIFELIKRTLGETVSVDMILTGDPWPVMIDVQGLDNILINLAINARDAMGGGGKLTIETSNVVLDESYTLSHPDIAPGQYVLIAVSDTGAGMDAEIMKKIFEPFFTTKEPGEGTGLGLSMVYGYVRQARGHVSVDSEVGHGTVFRIYLPRDAGAKNGEFASPPENKLEKQDGKIQAHTRH